MRTPLGLRNFGGESQLQPIESVTDSWHLAAANSGPRLVLLRGLQFRFAPVRPGSSIWRTGADGKFTWTCLLRR